MKKVILFLVDSLMPEILDDCRRHRTVPALNFLIERGKFWPDCVTVFPTMTASVDSSLLTGVYPDRHKVPGLVWYDPEKKEIINYINGLSTVWKLGIGKCARNVITNLNEVHLSKEVTTLFEELADRGKTSASINAIIHRGHKKHRVKLPFLLQVATRFQSYEDISGPEVLTLGALLDTDLNQQIPAHLQRATKMYGINDEYAVHVTRLLIQSGDQPDFILCYLPDNDHEVHRKNPAHAEAALIKVDHHLQEILNTFSSWDEAIEECVFIVISDHGQTRIGKSRREFNIDLDVLLHSFSMVELGEQPNHHDVVVCNNERSAYVYPLKPEIEKQLIDKLAADS
ncbi:MAG TPA: antitoxin, partial [Paenibacillaceae bacterium]|nr:antitoxin [Paenibacillaceae bacterium]